MASPQRRLDLVDAADHLTGGEHVVIVLAPLAREAAPSGALEN
jgi:hypothetical protein